MALSTFFLLAVDRLPYERSCDWCAFRRVRERAVLRFAIRRDRRTALRRVPVDRVRADAVRRRLEGLGLVAGRFLWRQQRMPSWLTGFLQRRPFGLIHLHLAISQWSDVEVWTASSAARHC